MFNIPNWYIAYTRPLQEKKVIARFSQKKIEHYCPMKKVKTQYYGREKIMNVPLFTSCVFVHVAPVEHHRIKKIWEVINLVHWLDKPVAIENAEIEMLRNFLNIHTDVTLEKIPVYNNKVLPGKHNSFSKEKGAMQEVMNGFIKLHWPSLGYELRASLNHEFKTSINAIQPDKYNQSSVTKLAI
ncbi:MAG TPA: transcription termination/antitermination NusG family protein [Chitinophagaceae bacterium]|nr:transcription termination/antitermination NusG family protein [Chitinophagaceae bacterium]